jgi:hypothetical protein
MPAIRPDAISNRIRLANEVAGSVTPLVSEHGAVDALLPTVVNEAAPNEHGIGAFGAQDKLFSWTDEQPPLATICIPVR